MSSKTRTNGRPSLLISALNPLDLDLPTSGNAWVSCPECTHTVEVDRGLVQTHRIDGIRCQGSAQHVIFDLTAQQHATRRIAARHQALRADAAADAMTVSKARASAVLPTSRRANWVTAPAPRLSRGSARTTMAAAFEEAWWSISSTSAAPAVHQIAARRALAAA
jgi:hypothetical protein